MHGLEIVNTRARHVRKCRRLVGAGGRRGGSGAPGGSRLYLTHSGLFPAGGYCAECLTEPIVTEGDTWEQLRQNVKEAVKGFYFDRPNEVPSTLRLHLVRDEVLAYA